MNALRRYLLGDRTAEPAAVHRLCSLGRQAAKRQGVQSRDADEIGVEFAEYLLVDGARRLQRHIGDLGGFVGSRARLFARSRSRRIRARLRTMVDQPLEAEAGETYSPDPLAAILARELVARLTAVLENQSLEDRWLFQWMVVEGITSRESARRLGCTDAAARKRLERLRSRLHGLLSY